MTRMEAKEILDSEQLGHYNWYYEHKLKENEVGIECENGQWKVFVTDERAGIVTDSVAIFKDEEEALENFIKRVRILKRLFK